MSARLAGLALLASVFAGCSAEFDPSSRITGLRVLAVRADNPYAPPGSTVNLTALAVDPAARELDWGWGTCVDPPSSEVIDCIDGVDWSSFAVSSDTPSHTVTIPSDAIARLPSAARPRATVGVVTVVCPGSLSVTSPPKSVQATGALPFRCSDRVTGRVLGPDEYVAGVKRIFVRESDRNANPAIARATWDDESWADATAQAATPCPAGGNSTSDCDDSLLHRVAAVASAGSVERGVDSFGVPYEEQVVVEYYATEGIFSDDVRIASDPVTKWVARKESAGSSVAMWMVLRDDRGGVDWTTRSVKVAR